MSSVDNTFELHLVLAVLSLSKLLVDHPQIMFPNRQACSIESGKAETVILGSYVKSYLCKDKVNQQPES